LTFGHSIITARAHRPTTEWEIKEKKGKADRLAQWFDAGVGWPRTVREGEAERPDTTVRALAIKSTGGKDGGREMNTMPRGKHRSLKV